MIIERVEEIRMHVAPFGKIKACADCAGSIR